MTSPLLSITATMASFPILTIWRTDSLSSSTSLSVPSSSAKTTNFAALSGKSPLS